MQIRSTTAKMHVLQLLSDEPVALSHLEIQEKSIGVCDRVTTYRVLDRLLGEGIIHKTVGLDGVTRYALCKVCEGDHKHFHNHVHFSCDVCLKVTCLEDVIPEFKLPRKYKVRDVNFNLSGICPECR